MISQFPPPGSIKSIQRGTIALVAVATATATISAVDLSKSIITTLGNDTSSLSTNRSFTRLTLTNSTTITADRIGASDNVSINYQIVEYF